MIDREFDMVLAAAPVGDGSAMRPGGVAASTVLVAVVVNPELPGCREESREPRQEGGAGCWQPRSTAESRQRDRQCEGTNHLQ